MTYELLTIPFLEQILVFFVVCRLMNDTLADDILVCRTFCSLGVMAHVGSLVSLRKYSGRGKVCRMKFLPIQ